MKRSFSADVKDKKMTICDPKGFVEFMEKIGNDIKVVVTIQKWYRKHSDSQRNYYFGVPVSILAEELGYTPKEMHEALKAKFLVKEGEKINMIRSITELSTVEFEDFMSDIRRWASAELSCYIPEPNEAPIGFKYIISEKNG